MERIRALFKVADKIIGLLYRLGNKNDCYCLKRG